MHLELSDRTWWSWRLSEHAAVAHYYTNGIQLHYRFAHWTIRPPNTVLLVLLLQQGCQLGASVVHTASLPDKGIGYAWNVSLGGGWRPQLNAVGICMGYGICHYVGSAFT